MTGDEWDELIRRNEQEAAKHRPDRPDEDGWAAVKSFAAVAVAVLGALLVAPTIYAWLASFMWAIMP